MLNNDWGTFIEPDRDLENYADINEKYKINIPSGRKANFEPFVGKNYLFDSIIQRVIPQREQIKFEDQCSSKYYYDMFNALRSNLGEVNRVAEVGVYLGGASVIFAGCLIPMNLTLDLIDPNKVFLQFTYERIRRAFPEAASRVRMFLGDLPTYVKKVMLIEQNVTSFIQHDGSHNFNEVVKDLASLSFVKDRVKGLAIQDTHLRSADIDFYTFVDAAVYTVFGYNMKFGELGVKFPTPSEPGYQYSTYFLDNHPEGMYIPFNQNHFRYPHASSPLDKFLPKVEDRLLQPA